MKKIIFMLIPLLLALFAFGPFKSFTVSGIVVDANGNGVDHAYVVEKNTSNAAWTDASGRFKIEINSSRATLIVSALGYATREINLTGSSKLKISLTPESENDSTVVQDVDEKSKPDAISQMRPRFKDVNRSITDKLYGSVSGVVANAFTRYPEKKGERYYQNQFNTEEYDNIVENPFLKVTDNPLSTFSIDVDAASYSNVRRFLNDGQLPPAGAVRIEEMINYFHYDYPQPDSADPFSVNTEFSDCPWNSDHKLVLVGLQGKKISTENLPPSNLVFLIDVSGSMMDENKLPLVKASMKMLVDQLREKDKVALVVYAGNAGLVLAPTSGTEKIKIKDAIDNLEAGGSTAGGEGLKLAYKTAQENFVKDGNNRIILCTDGDFNVGASSDDELVRMIEDERKSGVFLTVLGFGMGNYKDSKMEKLADKGNGNHAYIDGMNEAKKVLVNEFGGTLFSIAQDVKLQIEFNPTKVQGYRLIGYENRMLNKEDFNDDKKDAGELGSGHTVTALYEIVPVGVKDSFLRKVDDLKYQKNKSRLATTSSGDEIMNIKLRYKQPRGTVSNLIEHPVGDKQKELLSTTNNFRFAAAVAEFGMMLRESDYKAKSSFISVTSLAQSAKGEDTEGYRSEFIRLVGTARSLATRERHSQNEDDNMVKTNK